MEKYKLLEQVQQLIEQGVQLGMDLTDIQEKLRGVQQRYKDDVVRIVLLGTVSNGKTTVLGGLFEQLFENMKIATAESSDQLNFYHPDGLGQGYEIVDTPGLFGNKTKEIDGKAVKYSEITQQYISEAHVLIVVCDAQTPVIDSHKDELQLVLRNLKKLDSTIFVLNGMDNTGCSLLDDEDFENTAAIKKEWLKNGLKQIIGLTDEECERLHIVCIAADPNRRGLDFWLEHKELYRTRSRMGRLREELHALVAYSDRDHLIAEADRVVIQNMLSRIFATTVHYFEFLSLCVNREGETLQDMKTDLDNAEKDLLNAKKLMTETLTDYRNAIIRHINNVSSFESLNRVIEEEVGMHGNEITGSILNRHINQIIEECVSSNQTATNHLADALKMKIDKQDSFFGSVLSQGEHLLKGFKLNNKMVLKIRDVAFKNYKFKPYGAGKLAKKGNVVLAVALEAYDWWKDYKQAQKLQQAKDSLKTGIQDTFEKLFSSLDDRETYFKNFAPEFIGIRDDVQAFKKKVEVDSVQKGQVEQYRRHLKDLMGDEITDVEFTEC